MDLGLIAQGALTKIIGSNRAFHATASVLGKYKPSLWQAAKPQPFGRLSNCNISRFVFELIGCPMPGGTSKECTLCTSCAPFLVYPEHILAFGCIPTLSQFLFLFPCLSQKENGTAKKINFRKRPDVLVSLGWACFLGDQLSDLARPGWLGWTGSAWLPCAPWLPQFGCPGSNGVVPHRKQNWQTDFFPSEKNSCERICFPAKKKVGAGGAEIRLSPLRLAPANSKIVKLSQRHQPSTYFLHFYPYRLANLFFT